MERIWISWFPECGKMMEKIYGITVEKYGIHIDKYGIHIQKNVA